MKIQLLSDLHLDCSHWRYQPTDADVVVLAGDIHVGTAGIEWILSQITDKPVIYVLGNHEYYCDDKQPETDIYSLAATLKDMTRGSRLHVLENDEVTLGEVRFLGCSLWSDYGLFGNQDRSTRLCQQCLQDYRQIRSSLNDGLVSPEEIININRLSQCWLSQRLRPDENLPTVVVTHHAPTIFSTASAYRDTPTTAAYVCDMSAFINQYRPQLWLHGHLHSSADYNHSGCRIVCNPLGYHWQRNREFDPACIIDL